MLAITLVIASLATCSSAITQHHFGPQRDNKYGTNRAHFADVGQDASVNTFAANPIAGKGFSGSHATTPSKLTGPQEAYPLSNKHRNNLINPPNDLVYQSDRQRLSYSLYHHAKNLKLHLDTGTLQLSPSDQLPFPSSRGFSLPLPSKNRNNVTSDYPSSPSAVFTYRFDRDTVIAGPSSLLLHFSTTGDTDLRNIRVSVNMRRVCRWLTTARSILATIIAPYDPSPPEFSQCGTPEMSKGMDVMAWSSQTVTLLEASSRRILQVAGQFEVVPMIFLRGDEMHFRITGGTDERTGSQVIHSGSGIDSYIVFGK